MRQFKVPLIVTGVALLLALVIGIAGVTRIHQSTSSNRQKQQRAQLLGSGVATATCIVIAPFWLYAAAQVGKRRREAQARTRRGR